jgi:hypothetical protein
MKVHFTVPVLLSLTLASCTTEPTCESICEEQSDCPDYESDCVQSCEEGGARAEENGCPETFDELAGCLDEADDICRHGCDTETSAFIACSCSGGSCLGGGECSYATTGEAPLCSVLGLCGEDALTFDCGGEDEPCVCKDAEGEPVASVPYDAAFCSGDREARGEAAAAACGW